MSRILERNAVYVGDTIVGFRCDYCGRVFQSMLGEVCQQCRDRMNHNRFDDGLPYKRHKLKEMHKTLVLSGGDND